MTGSEYDGTDEFAEYDLTATYDGTLWKTHGPAICSGLHCTLHNPSNHHMREWPIELSEGGGRSERICEHDIGHPDPDHIAYVGRRHGWIRKRMASIHGCDGCCVPMLHPDQSST